MKIDNVKLSPFASESELMRLASQKSRIKPSKVKTFKVLKKSLDARDKSDVKYVYSVEISDREEIDTSFKIPTVDTQKKVGIIGFGPCGIAY